MAVYISLTIAVLVLAYFIENNVQASEYDTQKYRASRQQALNIFLAFAIFLLLVSVSAARIAVGNDYWKYRENFKLIYSQRTVSSEIGFNAIVYIMQVLFGYDNYLPIFGFFSVITGLFFVIGLYKNATWFLGTMFIFMTSGFYFNSLNNIRYYLAIAIVIFTYQYLLKEEYTKFIVWILIGALFHKSILLVIPAYLIIYWFSKYKIKKWMLIIVALLITSFIILQDFFRFIIFKIYPFYENSAFDRGETSSINIIKGLAVLFFAGICYNSSLRDKKDMRFYFWLNVVGFIVSTFGAFIPEVTRISIYFYISQIFFIPLLIIQMKRGRLQNLCGFVMVLAFSLYFGFFLIKVYDINIRLLPYLNWIFN